jgi:hypothetical protein
LTIVKATARSACERTSSRPIVCVRALGARGGNDARRIVYAERRSGKRFEARELGGFRQPIA